MIKNTMHSTSGYSGWGSGTKNIHNVSPPSYAKRLEYKQEDANKKHSEL